MIKKKQKVHNHCASPHPIITENNSIFGQGLYPNNVLVEALPNATESLLELQAVALAEAEVEEDVIFQHLQ